jgi:two-component system chemotaxis response regulator CheY
MTEPRKKVLVIDDSATVRAQVTTALGPTYDCVEAANGQEGFERAVATNPAAVIADLEMPVLDGLGFLRLLRAEPRTKAIPVIVITTVTAVEKVNECRTLGCAGFVLKPVDTAYLLAKLAKLCRANV